jgi:hypothetical protein
MTYRAIYAYAWDIEERGVPAFLDEVQALGLNTVTLAGAYHAGKFLRPHGWQGKVYFPEDGTVYFKPAMAQYGVLKPQENSGVARRDVFRALTDVGIPVNAWMVLLHNSRLGMLHPELCTENAFGDRYINSLCVSAPEARRFAVALCKDVTDSYPVMGVSIESPGFAPYVHGYHHEFALNRSNRWLDSQLGLCFCKHCLSGAHAAGIQAEALRVRVKGDIDGYLAGDLDFPDDMAEAFWVADTRSDGDLAAFLAWRCTVVTSLVAEIRAAVRKDAAVAVIPSVARPTGGAWYEGSDLRALADAAGIIEACFYERSPDRVAADAWDVKRRLRGAGHIRGILRPDFPDLQSAGEVVAAVGALRAESIEDIAFYNYGHLRGRSLDRIGRAMTVGS